MNVRGEQSDMPPDGWRPRRIVANLASAINAFCRGTGLTEPACCKVLLAAMDVSAGRQQFKMGFVPFGKRMAQDQDKNDAAYAEMTKRNLATLEAAQTRTGFHPLVVTRGDKKRKEVSEWEFPGLQWIAQIYSRGLDILDRERPKGRVGMNREACFDAAFVEIEPSIPKGEPVARSKPFPKRSGDRPFALIKTIGGLAKRLRIDALTAGADEKKIADFRDMIIREVDRVFNLPPETLQVEPILKTTPLSNPPTPPVSTKKGGAPPESLITNERGGKGGKTVGVPERQVQQEQGIDDKRPDTLRPDATAAISALDYLMSVDVYDYALLFLDDKVPKKDALKDRLELKGSSLRQSFPAFLEEATRSEQSLVVDMRPGGQRIIQVDDCNESILKILAPISVLRIKTSDESGQAIIVLPSGLSDLEFDTAKERLFDQLKGSGANRGASGASRWPGSFNFKPNRRRTDGSYPMVRLLGGFFGRTTTIHELDERGLLAPREIINPSSFIVNPGQQDDTLSWPEYDLELSVRDRSMADFKFSVAAAELSFPAQAIEERLLQLSPKARERSRAYAERTVRKAIEAVQSRHGPSSKN